MDEEPANMNVEKPGVSHGRPLADALRIDSARMGCLDDSPLITTSMIS